MKRIFTFLLMLCIAVSAHAQKLKGQWRGYFNSKGDIVLSDNNNSDNTEYVLELEFNGSVVTGYSYSYFNNRVYYVICSLKGNFDKTSKLLTVTEVERVKGYTPAAGWSDCFQTHVLHYEKQGNTEVLTGNWRSANTQVSDCGVGNTTLTRKTLSKNLASFNKSQNRTPVASVKKPVTKVPNIVAKTRPKTQPAITQKVTKPATTDLAKKDEPVKVIPKENIVADKEDPAFTDFDNITGFEKRDNNILKTITIENEDFKVSLYDNGDIDGDSVSLFYNGKLLLAHKRLGDKPISLTLDATTDRDVNELTMYAENLGEIPPNTALMVVNDGDKRYEVRIASDLKKSGTIRFIHRSKTP